MNLASLGKPVIRLAVMIGGELTQSALHFALNLVLIGCLSAYDYGVFAITLIIGGIGITYIRALTAMPATIFIGKSFTSDRARFYNQMFSGAAMGLSTLIALIAFAVLWQWKPNAAMAGGAYVGFWCIRSHQRSVQYAFGNQKIATIGDLVFAISGAMLALIAILRGGNVLGGVFLALAAANVIGGATMRALSGEPIGATLDLRARVIYSRLWRQLGWSAFSVTTTNIQGQGVSLLVASTAGPQAYAPIAVMMVAFMPLRIMGTALMNALQSEISRLSALRDARTIWRQSIHQTTLLAGLGLVYGVIVMAILPFLKVHALEGAPVHLIGVFAWAIYMISLCYSAPRVSLEVFMRFGTVALIMSVAAVTGLTTIAILLKWAPNGWALAGAALGEAMVLIPLWVVMIDELNEMDSHALPGLVAWLSHLRPRAQTSAAL